jgi:hypothetical protein
MDKRSCRENKGMVDIPLPLQSSIVSSGSSAGSAVPRFSIRHSHMRYNYRNRAAIQRGHVRDPVMYVNQLSNL